MSSLFEFANPCRRAQRAVLEELDTQEGLGETEEQHLRSCGHCRDYRREHVRLQAAIPRSLSPEPSESFAERTLAALAQRSQTTAAPAEWISGQRRVEPWIWAASVAAGLLLVGGLSWFAWPESSDRAADRSITARMAPIGREEMFPQTRDVAVLGFSFPSRSQKIWNFR